MRLNLTLKSEEFLNNNWICSPFQPITVNSHVFEVIIDVEFNHLPSTFYQAVNLQAEIKFQISDLLKHYSIVFVLKKVSNIFYLVVKM